MVHFEAIDAEWWTEGAEGVRGRRGAGWRSCTVWYGVSGDHTSAARSHVETETFSWKEKR